MLATILTEINRKEQKNRNEKLCCKHVDKHFTTADEDLFRI